MPDTISPTPRAVAEDYLAAWNEPDDASRRALLDRSWAEAATYRDPLMQGMGRDGVAAMIGAARGGFPGHRFVLRGRPDGHGDLVRFSWTLVSGEGVPAAGGTDVVRLDGEGRIRDVLGFLDGPEGTA